MNIEIKYTVTSEGELITLYGSVIGALVSHRGGLGEVQKYYDHLKNTLEPHIDPHLINKINDNIRHMFTHPESEANYSMDNIKKEANKVFNPDRNTDNH